jgi:hypothetical protein|nr:hypothetical protein [Kofleriaceae bacterium]
MTSISPQNLLLAVFGAVVVGFGLYLLVEVHASSAHATTGSGAVATEHEPHARPSVTVTPSDDPHDAPATDTPTTQAHAITSRHGMNQAAPAAPLAPGNLHNTTAGSDDGTHVDAHADALMLEANKSYDAGNYDEAKATADKVLAEQPHNVRMLRIEVSVACLDGDQGAAQKSYDALPKADRDQMKIRCSRSGITFTDSVPPP